MIDASGRGDQIGDALAAVSVDLFCDLEPRVLEDVADIPRRPCEAVAVERRARTDVDGEHFDVLAEGVFESSFGFHRGSSQRRI